MIKSLNKLLGKLDFRTDWESKLDDPEPLSVKSFLMALLTFIPVLVIGALIWFGAIYYSKYLEWTLTLPQF